MSDMKSARVSLRIDVHSDQLVRRAAEQSQMPVGRFIENAAVDAAERVLAERTRFAIPEAQWRQFVHMLDRPVRDLPGLDRADAAWERHFGGAA
jgi:uncharacterized protein (DUF1778 family)